MSAYLVAYGIVWLGLVAYLARFGARQRSLRRQFDTIQSDGEEDRRSYSSTAA